MTHSRHRSALAVADGMSSVLVSPPWESNAPSSASPIQTPWLDRMMQWGCLIPLILLVFCTLVDLPYLVAQIRAPHSAISADQTVSTAFQKGNESRPIRQAVLVMIFGLAAIGLLVPGSGVLELLNRQKVMLLFLFFALISVSWSAAPFLSLKRWVQFAGVLLVAWCAMRNVAAPERMIRILRWFFALALVLSCLIVVLKPEVGITAVGPYTAQAGAWKGIHWHKNELASAALLSAALWLPCLFTPDFRLERRLAPLMVMLSVFLVWQSNGKASTVSLIALASWWMVLKFPMRGTVKFLVAYIGVVIVALWFLNFQALPVDAFFTEVLGRSPTLNGRVPLWGTLLDISRQHPFLGVGYNAFWASSNFEALSIIFAEHAWRPMVGHNGYLDILVQLGLVGGGLFGLVLLQVGIRAARLNFQQESTRLALIFLLFAQILINFAESYFCVGTSTVWMTFLLTYVTLAKSRFA